MSRGQSGTSGILVRYTGGSVDEGLVLLPDGQHAKFAGAEGARSGNCHFAGEHTSIEARGYLNGAVESGERVTNENLADVKALA